MERWWIVGVLILGIVGYVLWWAWRFGSNPRYTGDALAIRRFKLLREGLEAKFVELAGSQGKPKGLRWENIEFHSPVAFVRDRRSGEPTAFVEITVRFAPIEGGGMEDVEAAHDLRNATAVFHCLNGRWGAGGKVLFNMTPHEAVERFEAQYEPMTPM